MKYPRRNHAFNQPGWGKEMIEIPKGDNTMKSLRQIGLAGLAGLVLAGCSAQETPGQQEARGIPIEDLARAQLKEMRRKRAAENRMSGQALDFPSNCARVVSLGERSYGQLGNTIQYVSCERADGSYSLWEEDCAVAGRWTEIKRYRLNPAVGQNKEQ